MLAELQAIAAVAPLATAIVAFVALLVAGSQLFLFNRNQRDQVASAVWREYEKLSFDNVEMQLAGETGDFNFENQTINGCKKQFQKYCWYISIMLLACKKVILVKRKKDWIAGVEYQIQRHKTFFLSFFYKVHYRGMESPSLSAIIDKCRVR